MNNSSVEDLKYLVETKKKVLIVSHYSPDGDAIGSSFGLANFLESINVEAHVYNKDQVPNYLNFLSTKNFHTSLKTIPKDIDLFFALDFNDFERAGDEMVSFVEKEVVNLGIPVVVIDHHQNNKIKYGSFLIDTEAASTGVLIYRLISKFGKPIDEVVATCLLTTIITDTSSFKNSNSNFESLKVSADLMDLGADLSQINDNIFKLGNIAKLKLRTKIHSTLLFEEKLKVAICYAKRSFYEETGTSKEDSEGISNGLIFYNDAKIGIFIREVQDDKWKISTRTNNYIDLSVFANLFGGGGHKNASGFTFDGKLPQLIKQIIKNLEK